MDEFKTSSRPLRVAIFTLLAVVLFSVLFFSPFAAADNVPQGLTATYSNGNVTLSWNPVENATLYKIYRGLSSGNESYYGNTTNTTFIDSNVSAGHTYYYYVTAVVNGNETNKSAEVYITISDNSGGAGTVIKKYLKFNSYMLYTALFLLAAAIPLWAFGARTHKDVAKYALLLGIILLLFSWGTAYFNTNIQNITLFNQTLNTLLVAVGVLMLIVGVVIYIAREKKHEDVAKFSAVFGLLLLFFAWLIQYLQ